VQVETGVGTAGTNVAAVIKGWVEEGKARVQLLAPMEGHPIGSELVVGVRIERKARPPADFSVLRKMGLRVGGIVLLRRLREDNGAVTARSAEILTMRESDGPAFVIHDAATCILPPPPGTAMVKEALVAMLAQGIPSRTLTEGIAKVLPELDQPIVFGHPGLAYVGRTKTGEALEVIVGGDEPSSANDLIARMLRECPSEIIKLSRTTGTDREPWRLIPFFRAPIDPDRSSKLSAQAINLGYGDVSAPKWTVGNVVLRLIADRWHVCDASPAEEPTTATRLVEI
jgi:hypothetical protein